MPFRARDRECEKADGTTGNYVIEKQVRGSWRQFQCFERKEDRDNVLGMLKEREESE